MSKKNNRGLKIAGGILAGLLVAGAASGAVAMAYGDEISNWWDDITAKEEVKVKKLTIGNELTESSVIQIDMAKLVDYLRDNEEEFSDFINYAESSNSSDDYIILLDAYDFQLSLFARSQTIYLTSSDSYSGIGCVQTYYINDLDDLKRVGIVRIPFTSFYGDEDFTSTEIIEILGVEVDEDGNVVEDLGIITIEEVE